MSARKEIKTVTARIRERSRASREAYLERIEQTGAACLERTPEISALRRSWSFLRMSLRS